VDVILPVYKTFLFPHSNSMLSPIVGRAYGVGETDEEGIGEADDDEADDDEADDEGMGETGMNLI